MAQADASYTTRRAFLRGAAATLIATAAAACVPLAVHAEPGPAEIIEALRAAGLKPFRTNWHGEWVCGVGSGDRVRP